MCDSLSDRRSSWPCLLPKVLLSIRFSASASPQRPTPSPSLASSSASSTSTVTPRRVRAEWGTTGILHIEVDVAGLSEESMNLIAAKVGQATPIFNAFWHYV